MTLEVSSSSPCDLLERNQFVKRPLFSRLWRGGVDVAAEPWDSVGDEGVARSTVKNGARARMLF